MYFPPFDYELKNMVYLGSARNPHTKRPYDFYWINNESYTAKHGIEESDYGSHHLRDSSVQIHTNILKHIEEDFIWGMEQAKIASLYYLATGETPLRPMEYDEDELYQYDTELYTYPTPTIPSKIENR